MLPFGNVQTAAGACGARWRGQRSRATFTTLFSTTADAWRRERVTAVTIRRERVTAAGESHSGHHPAGESHSGHHPAGESHSGHHRALTRTCIRAPAVSRRSAAATPRVAQKPCSFSSDTRPSTATHRKRSERRIYVSALGCCLQARLLFSAAKTEGCFSLFSTCAAGFALAPNRTLPYAAFASGTAAALIFISSL
jgi:hypothetical protein